MAEALGKENGLFACSEEGTQEEELVLCLVWVCSCCWRLIFRGSRGWVNLCLGWVRPTPGTSERLGRPGRGREPHSALVVFGPGSQPRCGPQLPATSWVTKEAEAGEVEEELAPGPGCHLSLLAAASLNLCPDGKKGGWSWCRILRLPKQLQEGLRQGRPRGKAGQPDNPAAEGLK